MSSPPPTNRSNQFSLRAIFIAIAVLALVFAAVGPLWRQWPGEQRLAFAAVWGSALAWAVLWCVVYGALRAKVLYHAMRGLGPIRFWLNSPTRIGGPFRHIFLAFLVLALLGARTFVASFANEFGFALWWFGFAIGVASGQAVAFTLLRPDRLELRELGARGRGWWQTWDSLWSYEWGTRNAGLLVLTFTMATHKMRVRAAQRAEVHQFLAKIIAEQRAERRNKADASGSKA